MQLNSLNLINKDIAEFYIIITFIITKCDAGFESVVMSRTETNRAIVYDKYVSLWGTWLLQHIGKNEEIIVHPVTQLH